jgi:hypothetical protein
MFVCKAEKVRTEVRSCLLRPAASSKCVRREGKEGSSKESDELVQSSPSWPMCRGKPDTECSFLLMSSPHILIEVPDLPRTTPETHT